MNFLPRWGLCVHEKPDTDSTSDSTHSRLQLLNMLPQFLLSVAKDALNYSNLISHWSNTMLELVIHGLNSTN